MKYSSKNENLCRKVSLKHGEISYESIWNLLQKIIFTNHMSHQSSGLERETLLSITQKRKSSEISKKNVIFPKPKTYLKVAQNLVDPQTFQKIRGWGCEALSTRWQFPNLLIPLGTSRIFLTANQQCRIHLGRLGANCQEILPCTRPSDH